MSVRGNRAGAECGERERSGKSATSFQCFIGKSATIFQGVYVRVREAFASHAPDMRELRVLWMWDAGDFVVCEVATGRMARAPAGSFDAQAAKVSPDFMAQALIRDVRAAELVNNTR